MNDDRRFLDWHHQRPFFLFIFIKKLISIDLSLEKSGLYCIRHNESIKKNRKYSLITFYLMSPRKMTIFDIVQGESFSMDFRQDKAEKRLRSGWNNRLTRWNSTALDKRRDQRQNEAQRKDLIKKNKRKETPSIYHGWRFPFELK